MTHFGSILGNAHLCALVAMTAPRPHSADLCRSILEMRFASHRHVVFYQLFDSAMWHPDSSGYNLWPYILAPDVDGGLKS